MERKPKEENLHFGPAALASTLQTDPRSKSRWLKIILFTNVFQMGIAFDKRLRPAANVLVRELDGEAVLLNLDNESYYGLNEIGARMWSVVTASDSVEAACSTLMSEFDVDAQTLRQDMQTLIDQWIEHGLTTIDDG